MLELPACHGASRLTHPAVRIAAFVMLVGAAASLWMSTSIAAEESRVIALTSPEFSEGQSIPARYTCEGEDISPPLTWTEPPAGTNSFALISEDPDAPHRTWIHWVVYNLPPLLRQLPEAFPTDAERPDGTRQGLTDFGRTGYGGPCPPSGTHRYVFTLYCLDVMLALPPRARAKSLEETMRGHLLAEARLTGTYHRARR